jgi:hypothetical protein
VNLVEQVAEVKGAETPPVIIMYARVAETASLSVEMMRLATDLHNRGAADFIEKPFLKEGRTLDRVIKKVLKLNGHSKPTLEAPSGHAKRDGGHADQPSTELQTRQQLQDGCNWMTVTEAAELLMQDLPSLDLKHARARVSVAAARGDFQTNEKDRQQRRVEKHSFNTWRLKQRDRCLDDYDNENV